MLNFASIMPRSLFVLFIMLFAMCLKPFPYDGLTKCCLLGGIFPYTLKKSKFHDVNFMILHAIFFLIYPKAQVQFLEKFNHTILSGLCNNNTNCSNVDFN